jgi:hypothetical protein
MPADRSATLAMDDSERFDRRPAHARSREAKRERGVSCTVRPNVVPSDRLVGVN